jgi:hypothetical protein
MRIRPLWIALAILLVPAIARADGHRARFFGAYSLAQGSVLKGAHINVDYVGDRTKYDYLAPTVDYSVHDGDGFQRHTFTAGVNVSHRYKHVVVAGQALGGRVWGDGSADWAGSFGGVIELIGIGSPTDARLEKGVWVSPRIQSDWIVRSGEGDSFWRFSTGFVVRWAK